MLILQILSATLFLILSSSIGFEILEDVGPPDIVLVCCGGGGVVSGTAAAIKLSGHKDCRIYAVEPEGGKGMTI